MKTPRRLTLSAVPGIPLLQQGDDLGAIVIAAIAKPTCPVRRRYRGGGAESGVEEPGPHRRSRHRYAVLACRQLAVEVNKDPRLVEVILSESVRIVRKAPNVLIVEHRTGCIMANAGVDQSNVPPAAGQEPVLLLPKDADAAAEGLRAAFEAHFSTRLGVVINDSFGRPWRRGTVGVALGAAGIPSLKDLRGQPDLNGRPLQFTESGFADEVAAAASLLMGQADEGHPVVLVSGFALTDAPLAARA